MFASLLALVAVFGTSARIEIGADRVQIGEPFEITFVVEHDTGASVKLPETSVLPRNFAFIEDLGLRREINARDPNTTTTRARWRVMALEGGELELSGLDIGVDASGATQMLHAAGPKLTVEHALKDGEDAPRPARGFRDAPIVHTATAKLTWIGIGLAALVGLFVARRWMRRKKVAPVAPVPVPVEQLRALEQRVNTEPERSREHVFALTSLLRRAIDAHTTENRAALNDEDWIGAIAADPRVPTTSRDIAKSLLADAESVKYAGETPSILRVRDQLARANEALLALNSTTRSAA
ncbi:MAG: hypothetical protein SGI72_06165 [Planctomycetota bacterium]|nr:hypothetical protein [Planctomycetota bacterium]